MTSDQPIILLLSGYASSGKDAVANLLVDEFGFVRHAFADALKVDCAHLSDLPLSAFHSREKDMPLPKRVSAYPSARTPRDICIQHAVKVRSMDTDAYSRTVARDIQTQIDDGRARFVISDWRFLSEVAFLKKTFPTLRIVTCRILRPSVTPFDSASEHELDSYTDFDRSILNNGTLAELRSSIRFCMRSLL
jgi:hypothetical protein